MIAFLIRNHLLLKLYTNEGRVREKQRVKLLYTPGRKAKTIYAPYSTHHPRFQYPPSLRDRMDSLSKPESALE